MKLTAETKMKFLGLAAALVAAQTLLLAPSANAAD